MSGYVGAIDQGTTSTRFIIFDRRGEIVALDQREHAQICPQPGWVEHDAAEIWRNAQATIEGALAKARLAPSDLSCVGLTNQRETTLLWDRRSGAPLANAIVWMDARTEALVARYSAEGGKDRLRAKTGLPLSTYFSSLKLVWLLEALPGARERAEAGEILFGTMDSWIAFNLTGLHFTDATNAARTQLMNLETLQWDEELLRLFAIPRALLPEIRSSSEIYGACRGALAGVPLAAALGDQHAALIGEACFAPGDAKNTYGTGCFLLMNVGETPRASTKGLLSTLAYKLGEAKPVYALEGSVAIAGALTQWLRDNLGIISSSRDIETLARSVPDNGDVYFVPAFSGLYAPYWRADARGLIAGLTRFSTKAHIARAALEAAAFQTFDILEAMEADSGVALAELRVDGGMSANALLMQFQADMLGAPVVRPHCIETTALGAAYAAGLATGVWKDTEEVAAMWRAGPRWRPLMPREERDRRLAKWRKAVARSFDWSE
ncbi:MULTISPECIES: glycerol kinase GlpK [Methylosinus]|uniref:Glycerol kinase n=1 Tax=Methylosinus trichosporium (strain ATCC 35070 / NCIMB 11131 / UNIQEM 75 / OB3b) TaxID=595536 RepID=A0A2D2D5Q8_METT3|nr:MULTISPECIES: glycerol kinase GlpK [Methylosinus]ATQ70361.1 glycerol kinase [Methylosinus trichosporium OB3b]OBS51049.1 glycerol kinase [Methylosinus sp. 3S-1]